MRQRKILFLCPSLGSGGSEKMFVRIANHCFKTGFDVKVALLDAGNPHYRLDSGIEVIDLKTYSLKNSLIPVLKTIHRIKPDIVFTTLTAMNAIVVFGTFFFWKVKFVARESTIISVNNKNSKYSFLLDLIVRWLYPRFDRIVAQSLAMKNDLQQNYGLDPSMITQIYNPIEAIHLEKVNRWHTVPVFITVGNLRKEKGYIRLIEALALLEFDYKYYIVGEGEEMEEIKLLIEKLGLTHKIVLTGRQNNPYVYLQQADLYLMASHYEGFPNALLEAEMLGLPVVAYKVPGGISEIITEGNGFLVQDNDVEQFCSHIKLALNTHWDKEAIRDQALQRFNYPNIMEKYVNLFQHV